MAATSHTRKDAAVIAELNEVLSSVSEVKGAGFEADKDSLEEIGDTINHTTIIWPYATNLTATLTSGAQNVWGAWTRLVDSVGAFFDNQINAHIHMTSVNIESEQTAGIYILEISCLSAGVYTVIARVRWNSIIAGIFAAVQQYRIRSPIVLRNCRIYGRVMSDVVAGTQAVTYHLRYYTHE